jgi:hypothetical protein
VLYDVSSSYSGGGRAPRAGLGYPRQGKRGTPQTVYGLPTDRRRCPVAVEVFERRHDAAGPASPASADSFPDLRQSPPLDRRRRRPLKLPQQPAQRRLGIGLRKAVTRPGRPLTAERPLYLAAVYPDLGVPGLAATSVLPHEQRALSRLTTCHLPIVPPRIKRALRSVASKLWYLGGSSATERPRLEVPDLQVF